ncbi:MAG: serine/threonine-protein kinase [Polyangiaceae bacterium]
MSISSLSPGAKLDRYEMLCPIAQGGMAQVWVGRLQGRHGFEKLVAVKTILAQHAADPRFQNMFLDEASIIASIRHPNVAQILDLGQEGDLLYLILEWVDGDSVAALRRVVHSSGEKLPLGIVLRICSDTLAGLHAAHEIKSPSGTRMGVVHRDVSPANVLVSTSGEVKVIDFGVAKAINRLSEETSAGVIKGKVAYMAPEQALGKEIDARADIWAAGVMLYQLLSGRTPYEGDNQLATLAQLVKGLPPEPIRGVPPEIGEIVYTALSYSPEGRYATAEEMHRALETAIVQLCGPTTQSDVAAYVSDKLAPRIEKRKKLISRALDAAESRADLVAEVVDGGTGSHSVQISGELRTPTIDQAMMERAQRAAQEIPELNRGVDEVMSSPIPKSSPPPLPDTKSPPAIAHEPSVIVPSSSPSISDASIPTLPRAVPGRNVSLDSIPPTNFGTRRKGPLVIIGFAAVIALLGYGAWLAYDRMVTERELAAPPELRKP